MAYGAKIILDSISPRGHRLVTFEVTLPRIVLAEFNTHRMFSRNSASSRAIPVQHMIRMVEEDPYIPDTWGKNQKGMQAEHDFDGDTGEMLDEKWREYARQAIAEARELLEIGVHKQITNRLLEPFLWHTIVVTATEWENFFHLRNNKMAHPAIQRPAAMMEELYRNSRPILVEQGKWHLPLIQTDEVETLAAGREISSARCARTSYLTHDGKRDLDKDFELHRDLLGNGHMSPFEHPARPMTDDELETYRMEHLVLEGGFRVDTRVKHTTNDMYFHEGKARKVLSVTRTHFCGNFNGWMQYRKEIPYEEDILAPRSS